MGLPPTTLLSLQTRLWEGWFDEKVNILLQSKKRDSERKPGMEVKVLIFITWGNLSFLAFHTSYWGCFLYCYNNKYVHKDPRPTFSTFPFFTTLYSLLCWHFCYIHLFKNNKDLTSLHCLTQHVVSIITGVNKWKRSREEIWLQSSASSTVQINLNKMWLRLLLKALVKLKLGDT